MAYRPEQCQDIMTTAKGNWPDLLPKLGVLVDDNKYFWLDNQGRLGVELYPRALSISWESTPVYWTYSYEKIHNAEYEVEIAKLRHVWWFDVKGELDMRELTVGVEYEMFFNLELSIEASGWSKPVTFEHESFGSKRKFKMRLDHLVGKGRTQVYMGKLKLPRLPIGNANATFHIHEHESRKDGLIVIGVTIKPAKH
ncbi:hypothetical protein V2J09_001821 [Rumex salicifolius]